MVYISDNIERKFAPLKYYGIKSVYIYDNEIYFWCDDDTKCFVFNFFTRELFELAEGEGRTPIELIDRE